MAKYLVVAVVKPLQTKKVYANLPLHLTVFPWFETNQELSALILNIRFATSGVGPFQVKVGMPDWLGPNNGYPANLVEAHEQLLKLHRSLFKLIELIEARVIPPDSTGEKYRPHITWVEDDDIEEVGPIVLRELALLQRVEVGRKVVSLFELRKEPTKKSE